MVIVILVDYTPNMSAYINTSMSNYGNMFWNILQKEFKKNIFLDQLKYNCSGILDYIKWRESLLKTFSYYKGLH